MDRYNRTTFRATAVTRLLCYFTYLSEAALKLRFFTLTVTAVNMTKVVIYFYKVV